MTKKQKAPNIGKYCAKHNLWYMNDSNQCPKCNKGIDKELNIPKLKGE